MNSHYKAALIHFNRVDPILFSAAQNIDPFVLKTSNDYFTELCKSIIYQQLSVLAGRSILNKFHNLFPNNKITVEYLLQIPDEQIRKAGISFPKIKYLKDLSQKVLNQEILFDKIQTSDEDTIINILTQVKGIGKWTAEMFMMFSLGRPDIFSAGDLGLRNAIQRLYKLDNKPTEKQLLQISSKWSPYRTYACVILWRNKK